MTEKGVDRKVRLRQVLDSAYRSKREYVSAQASTSLVNAINDLLSATKHLLPGQRCEEVIEVIMMRTAYTCLGALRAGELHSIIICQRVEQADLSDYICRAAALRGVKAISLTNVNGGRLGQWACLCADLYGLRKWHEIQRLLGSRLQHDEGGNFVRPDALDQVQRVKTCYERLAGSICQCPDFLRSQIEGFRGAGSADPAIVCQKVTAVVTAGPKKRSARRSLRRDRRKSIIVNAVS